MREVLPIAAGQSDEGQGRQGHHEHDRGRPSHRLGCEAVVESVEMGDDQGIN